MTQNLIYQDANNPDSVIYSPELLDDQESWAFIRANQLGQHDDSGDEESDLVLAMQYGQTSGKGLKSYLSQKEKHLQASASGASKPGADGVAKKEGQETQNFDRLRGMLDSDDPRFERLHRENIQHLKQGVETLSNNMGLAIDNFFSMTNETFRDIRHQANFSKDSLIPQANIHEVCPEMIKIAKAPWQFGNLPGVYSRVPKLVQDQELLAKLHKKLIEMKPMSFWSEPLEFMPQPSESFFHTIKELLGTIAAKDLAKLNPMDSKQLITLQSNALQSMFGLAVLSGSYEMIIQALNTISDFTERATEDNIKQVFAQTKPALESYLAQIVAVASEQRAYHTFHSDNISAVFGSQMKVYPSMQFGRNNTSITSDGAYIYLLIGHERNAIMYKIGTGMEGTLAGYVYYSRQNPKEGHVTWAFCQGKLYLRRSGEAMGTVHVVDPNDFKIVNELKLDLEHKFKGSKELIKKNYNYPLLSDGDHLYTIIMTVERRERAIKEEHKTKAKALQTLKQEKRNKQKLDALEAKEKKEKEDQEKGKKEKLSTLLFRKDASLENFDEVDFFHGQQYFVVVFKALKFDLSREKREPLLRMETSVDAPEKEKAKDIDFLSMSETQLFGMPIVQEMFATFSGFYNIKRCALALQHNNDDIHEAGQWLIEEKDAPFMRAHAMKEKQKEVQKKEPPVLEVAQEFLLSESILKSKWDQTSKENPEISTIPDILTPECLECGKWTVNRDQMTYLTDYRGSMANQVFSLKHEDIVKRKIKKDRQAALETSSFENSRIQPSEKDSQVPVPAFIGKRKGPGEEKFSEEMTERIKKTFNDNDVEGNGSICMESFGTVMQELGLLHDDDGERMEEAFYGLDIDDSDTMRYEDFLLIARRLNYRKKQDEARDKMAEISEEAIEAAFNKNKTFNQVLEEDCLTWDNCLHALQSRFKIMMNPREYDVKFQEYDQNRDRCLSFEEFRRFMGKEPKDSSEQKKQPKNQTKVFISNLVFFWDGAQWQSFTPQEVQEGMHTAQKESKRSEMAKHNAEEAKDYDYISEWSLYEDISVYTSNIFMEAERGRQLERGACYTTYDRNICKYVCMSLTHSYNFFLVDDQMKTIPCTYGQAPSTELQSMASLHERVLDVLSWVNERRYQMPWRWSLWSQTFKNVLLHIENNRKFLQDYYIVEEDQNNEEIEKGEAKAHMIKKIRKRLQIFKEREVTRELYRLNQPIANNEQAIAYRAKKVQKTREDKQKSASKLEKQEAELDQHVLPLEKIYLAQENRKMFAFCTTGCERVVRGVFNFLKAQPQNLVCYRALLDCFAFADQLLAYHDQSLINKIKEFCIAQVVKDETSVAIKQYIWRILVIGWYKFASNSEQQISLLSLFVAKSAHHDQQSLEKDTWLSKLLDTKHLMSPIELFNHRFYSIPATFFFLEMIQMSKVDRYHVCLKSDELYDPQLVGDKDKAKEKAVEPTPPVSERTDDKKQILAQLDNSVLSNTTIFDGPEKPPIVFRNKSKISLLSNYKELLSCMQVSQSLTKVPIEYVELKNLKASSDYGLPVTESYFSMPLYQILNDEMINFNSPDLPKDDIDFLCERYSDDLYLDQPDLTAAERKEVQLQHLIHLREANKESRQTLIDAILKAINQGQGTRENVTYPWNNQSSPAMINVLRRLLQAAFAIIKVHNPRQLKCTIDMLGQIDNSISSMREATGNFDHTKMSVTNFKWLEQIKSLILTVLQSMQCSLGYIMQTELAFNSLPLLMSIFENLKHLFKRQITETNEETKETTTRACDILSSLTTLNIEGADPTVYRVFDSRTQVKESYRIAKAIAYSVEFEPAVSKNIEGSFNIHTSRSEYEIHLRDISHYKNLVLIGSSLTIRFNQGRGNGPNGGVSLIIKPIIGETPLLPKDQQAMVKELEQLLTSKRSHSDTSSEPGSQAISWIGLLNQLVFVMSFLTRGLQESDLISHQTNGALKNGAGIFKNFGEQSEQLKQKLEFDEALNYALPKPLDDILTKAKSPTDSSIVVTTAEIEKLQLTHWHLFKGGLIFQQVEGKSSFECILEGLRLISDSLLRRQDDTIKSMAEVTEIISTKDKGKKKDSLEVIQQKKKTESFMRRQTTLIKMNEEADNFQGRQEVWTSSVKKLIAQENQQNAQLISQVVNKMRKSLIAEQFPIVRLFMMPTAKPYRALWTRVQELFVAAVLYHSEMIDDCETFLKIPDAQCKETCNVFIDQSPDPESLFGTQKVVYQFWIICKKVNELLDWMKNRIDGQKFFNCTVQDTIAIAKECITKAVGDHRQQEELKQMRQAEDETIAYNIWLKEKEEKEKKENEERAEAEKKKKEEEDLAKKQQRKSAGKVRSSAPAGMRRNQRNNISRLHRDIPKAQQKKGQAAKDSSQSQSQQSQKDSAPTVLGAQSPLLPSEEAKAEEEVDKVPGDLNAEKTEEIQILDLTENEVTAVKKEIYDLAFKKFEEQFGSNVEQLCSYFAIEPDHKDQSKTLRDVFKNIKSRLISYIDFDNQSIPIPAKFSDKMIQTKNPYEEIGNDVINRLNFLFEITPSKNYHQKVTKPLKVNSSSNLNAGFDEITYQDLPEQLDDLIVDETSQLKHWSKVSSDNPADLMSQDSSPLQAIFVFARSIRLRNLVPLRNIMLDQIYTANFRLYGLQIMQQLYSKISPTIFSRFVRGSLSYSVDKSIMNKIETCGQATSRKMNAMAFKIMLFCMQQIKDLHEKLTAAEESKPKPKSPEEEKQSELESERDLQSARSERSQAQVKAQLQNEEESDRKAAKKGKGKKKKKKGAKVSSKLAAARDEIQRREQQMSAQQQQHPPGMINFGQIMNNNNMPGFNPIPGSNPFNFKPIGGMMGGPAYQRQQALEKAQQKKANLEMSKLIEIQRSLLQSLDDIRVLLSNQYSKDYFIGSLQQSDSDDVDNTLSIGMMTQLFKVMIQHIIGAEAQKEEKKEPISPHQMHSPYAQLLKGAKENARNLRTQLANASRTIIDLLLCGESQNSNQQLLNDIVSEIVVEKLEEVCYETRQNEHGKEETFVRIDDIKHKEQFLQLFKLFSELTRSGGKDKNQNVDPAKQDTVKRVAQLLANITLHVQVPEVMRTVIKIAKVQLRKVNIKEIRLLRTIEQLNKRQAQPQDFLSEAIRQIGAKISNSEQKGQINDENANKVEVDEDQLTLDQLMGSNENKAEITAPDSQKEYYVYTNLNCPLEEDFTFIVTTLWHWYKVNPHPTLKIIKDPAEILVEAPEQTEEEKKAEEEKKKAEEEKNKESEDAPKSDAPNEEQKANAPEEEKKADAPEEEKKADAPEEEKKADAPEEEKKDQAAPEEEQKAAPEAVPEEEKKGEPDAAPEEEKKELSEEEKQRIADEEAKEKVKKEKEDAEKKEQECQVNQMNSTLLKALKQIWKDFESNDSWIETMKQLKPANEENELEEEDLEEQNNKSSFAPSLHSILEATRGKEAHYYAEFIKEAEESPKKLIDLEKIMKQIIQETYTNPTAKDSQEVQEQKMKEKNFNNMLLAVLEEAVQIAKAMALRRSVPIAGPFSLEKAHQLTQLLNRAYHKAILPVPLLPFAKQEMIDKKVKVIDSEICAKDIMPITDEKVRIHCGKPDKKHYFTRFTIAIAPKELQVTICERNTAAELEEELLRRGKLEQMGFTQLPKGSRGGGNLITKSMPSPEPIASFKEFVQPTAASKLSLIQELIQLVRSLMSQKGSNQSDKPQLLKRRSTRIVTEVSESHEVIEGSVEHDIITNINKMLEQVATSASWSNEFSHDQKQIIIGLISLIGGWQPCLAIGQLVQLNNDSTGESKAIVINDNFGKGKISVIQLATDNVKISQLEADQVLPVYSSLIDLSGAFGRSIDTSSLFKAIMSLQKQITKEEQNDDMIHEKSLNAKDSIFSSGFLLQMLLKVATMLPLARGNQTQAVVDLIQVLIQISDRGQDDCEQEGKPQAFWETNLSRQWASLIDNSQDSNTNFYLPREFYQSKEQADQDSDLKLLADLDMQELIKRASTVDQQNQFDDVNFVQNKNYYLTGLSEQDADTSDTKVELKKTRKLKFFIDNIFPRAADVMSVDAYRGAHNMIQNVMMSVKGMLQMNWNMGIDELKYGCKGSEINFPDQFWDWSQLFYDEISVDSWVKAKLKPRKRKVDEDEEDQDDKQEVEDSKKLKVPALDKLLDLGIEEVLVQIKAIEYKRQSVLAEYIDEDSMTKHWLWIPIQALSQSSFFMEPVSISFLPQTLNKKFMQTLSNTAIAYARQSLIKIVQSLQSDTTESLLTFKMPVENLKLHDIISWAVWENYGSKPIVGWMDDLSHMLILDEVDSNKKKELNKKLSASKDMDEDQAKNLINEIFSECVDEFSRMQLTKNQSDLEKEISQQSSDSDKSQTLNQVKEAFDELVLKIEQDGPAAEKSDSAATFHSLIDQCVTNWNQLADAVASEKAVIDICREFENLKQMKNENNNQQGGDTLPLHELMPCKGKNAISTTFMFKRNGVRMTPGSRVQFWSDPDKIEMLKQIHIIKDQKLDMEPVRLPAGKVYVSIEQSVDIDILQDDEIVTNPKLELVVFQVPKEWTVNCWLTETITSSLMKEGAQKSLNFGIAIYEKLMKAIMTYYMKANAPGLLKSVTLRLITRLVVKIRFLYHQLEKSQGLSAEILNKPHLEKLFITNDFIQNLIRESKIYMEVEEEDIYNQNKAKILYPAIVQDSAELLAKIALPLQKSQAFSASSELLSAGGSTEVELPAWSTPLINVSHFLHFFRGESRLPNKLLDEIFSKTTRTHQKHHLDNVVVMRKIPNNHGRYTRTWIMNRLIEILKMHQARIIDPQRDICVIPDEEQPESFHSIVLFLDDFSHMRANDKDDAGQDSEEDDLAPKIIPLYSETDDEKEEGKDGDEKAEEENAVEERPSMYNCPNVGVCGGFENDIDNSTCVVCEAPRPPMDQLIAEFNAKKKADQAEAKAAAALDANSEDEEGEPLLHLRLKKLRRDLRHVISHDQRIIALQRLEEAKKAEEEAKEKAAETGEEGEKPKEEKPDESQEESKADKAEDSDASPDEEIVEMDDLPEDRIARLQLIGVDEGLIEEGGEMLDIIEMSAMEEYEKGLKGKKEAQAERRKRRKAKEDAKKAKALKDSGGSEEIFKLEVAVMKEATFDGETKVKDILAKALKDRLQKKDVQDAQQFEFSDAAKEAIKKMHKLFQVIEISKLSIPRDIEDKLADFGIRKETLKSNGTDDVIAKMRTIVLTDPIAFFKLFVSQGFDFWLTQACFPVCELKKLGINIEDLMDIRVLRQVRMLIESDFCKDRDFVSELDPALLRLVHKIPDRSEIQDFSDILNKGSTTDEEEKKASKAEEEKKESKDAEEEKKGEPDEEVKEEEKKELADEEDKKDPEDQAKPKKDPEQKAKAKADQQAKIKSVKEKLQKMKMATMWDFWQNLACNEKDKKSMTEEQNTKIKKVQDALNKPKKAKIFSPWKTWAIKHANDRKLTWEQTLQSTRPISCFNDIGVKDTYAQILDMFDQAQLRFIWAFIRIFNKNFTKAIRFINQTHTPISVPEKAVQPMSIGAYLSTTKDICLASAKNDLKFLILNRTAIPVAENDLLPKIVFTRLKDASGQQGEDADKPKVKPNFVQAFEQIKNMNVSSLRQPKPKGSLPHLGFRVVFKGEDVEGDGGPYRQVFQDWTRELQVAKQDSSSKSDLVDLLRPCANQIGTEQIGKDRFVISTASNSSIDIQKFFFLGIMMGVCCRTGVIFPLDLPKMFWKQLTGQRITLDDVVEVEYRFLRSMQQKLSESKEDYESLPFYWVTMLADDREFDLTEDGDGGAKPVDYEERYDFIRAALKARLTQTYLQIQAIRRGICEIIPESMLNIGNLDDVETWICGSSKPNIALLRRRTEYPKDEPDYWKDSKLIKNFWQFLEEISDEDKKKFIIFCWGQQRLPPDEASYINANLTFKIKAHPGRNRRGHEVNMDDQLPTASTCFFHFVLPKYTNLDAMMKKILIAINMDCISMNAEVRRQHFNNDGNNSEEE